MYPCTPCTPLYPPVDPRGPLYLASVLSVAEARLSPQWISAEHMRAPSWGPHLHRWGGAFPGSGMLDESLAFVPSARVAFCGDFVEGHRAGSVEGAYLSGLSTAALLSKALL
eukprot:CAMPEP_0181252078 /NCGR_PEP_ID=MMETSP1096-20121128/47265_1 /TAXON_ID=156174 ORGANISM="Chrysochromulina ericina, Strain CCMP281" /NCGR_SAMPLE_ID=MMETSP1096 /ASSEMBLY_ACC=CAM_ASM_000453 /LENGTH=111 /DNA_ID=CAMNT_0023349797 /DNA_START=17 /DNA_END=352 /DNA_ORIENTATION=+